MTESAGPLERVSLAVGMPANASVAATEIAPSKTAGALVMYGIGPALPDAATTRMPAAVAFATASPSAESPLALAVLPKFEPSDMLITSMPLVTAQSIASATTSVLPLQ